MTDAERAPDGTSGEQVYVVPRPLLFPGEQTPQGFGDRHLEALLERIRTHGRFVPRAPAEGDPELKQIIPYVVVGSGDLVYGLLRRRKQTEARLHDKFSIGVGGHINPPDAGGTGDVLEQGLARELEEELIIDGPIRPRLAGWINDDANEVGSVHFGLVYIVEADRKTVRVRETDLMTGRFYTLEELRGRWETMETWSQIVHDHLFRPRDSISADPLATA